MGNYNKSILDALNGFQLRFHSLPPTRNKCNNPSFSANEKKSINLEVHKFLEKGIIQETLPCKNQFVTHIFTRPKKDRTHRVILNLKSLN